MTNISVEERERRYQSSLDPTTPSPFAPTAGVCGHCGAFTETQNYASLCYSCGRWSDKDGVKIEGNPHDHANQSETFPWTHNL